VNHINAQAQACPNQAFVLVGYSQGGEVIHRAAAVLDPSLYSRIYALTLFGDSGNRPNAQSPVGTGPITPFPATLANRTKESCAPNDPVCSNNGSNPLVHLGYSLPPNTYISDSANYIFSQYQSKGTSGPQPATFGGPGTGQPDQPTQANVQALAELVIILKLINPTAPVCPTYPTLSLF
jgi:Cutinase